ncbi:MAG: rhomboid family intramembrane serine protease [Deltaproteobacteria bacterium]|nr:rhomboid family intramembrane serine protease [Deltaproteobacteria bacterium]
MIREWKGLVRIDKETPTQYVEILEVGEKERIRGGKLCVKLVGLEGQRRLPIYVSFQVGKDDVWAHYFDVYEFFTVGMERCSEAGEPCHPSFKKVRLYVADGAAPWELPEWSALLEIHCWVDVVRVEEPIPTPPSPPPEEPPTPEPEPPVQPFNLWKWLQYGLRKILRDEELPSCPADITKLLVVAMALIYLQTIADIDYWVKVLGLLPIPAILVGEPWRVFTYMWLHYPMVETVNGLVVPHAHIAFNVLFLWVFGDNVECRLGHGKYLAYYLILGVLAGLGQVLWLHMIGLGLAPIYIIGASGAISGVMGMYLVFYPRNHVIFLGKRMPALSFLALWFLGQVGMLFSMNQTVAVAAHITGFVIGVVLATAEKRMEEELGCGGVRVVS